MKVNYFQSKTIENVFQMGLKSSIFSQKESNHEDNMEEFTIDTLSNRSRKELQDNDPELVPYYDAINSIIHSPDDFYIPSHATKVDDYLYLGSIEDAKDVDQLKALDIKYIINTVDDATSLCPEETKSLYDNTIKYLGFSSEDAMEYPIMDHFEETHAFIEEARKSKSKCLIHCMRAVNRSGVLATAHIMVKNNLGPITAVQIVYKKRGMLLTNSSFVSQLLRYARDHQYLEHDNGHILLNKPRT